jgi:NAD(P)-dependent dehydrogenase (short-subunit alcohol dehydrogenase family)
MTPENGLSVIITGGASGIGAATARRIVADGGHVGLVDIDDNRAEALAGDIGPAAWAVRADALDEGEMTAAHEALAAHLPPINGLVAAAGIPQVPKRIEDYAVDDWAQVMDSHTHTTYIANRVVGGAMAARGGGGAVVNVVSAIALRSGPTLAYAPAKAAVASMTEILAVQWAKQGVRVNGVAPGFTDTPFLKRGERQGKRDLTPIEESSPIGRLQRAEEIAEVIHFLLTPASSAVNGTVVACDGGYSAGSGWWGFGGLGALDA